MILTAVQVTNFRSLLNVTVAIDPITILVGPNGCGKSNLLQSLRFFYEQNYPITASTFYNRNTSAPISVSLTFEELTAAEREVFQPYVDGGALGITKEALWSNGAPTPKYYGMRGRCLDFRDIRQATGRAKTQAYNVLAEAGIHQGLENVTRIDEVDPALDAWEQANPDRCVRTRDEGQFFGWTGVGAGRIDQFSKWLYIPAVREAGSEGTDTKGAALKELVDLFLRPQLAQNPALQALKADATARLHEILDPANIAELRTISRELTTRLAAFSPGTSVHVGWRDEGAINVNLPLTGTDISEGQFSGPVEHAGHGTQRAFLIAILQYLVEARISSQAAAGSVPPHILLGIEEPELYLHPSRARLMSRVLEQLSALDGAGRRIQTIYATHSPIFLGMTRFNSVRKGRRVPGNSSDLPWTSTFVQARLEDVAADLAAGYQRDASEYSAARLLPRLATIMTPALSEGFFAELAVLVEGDEDRALIVGEATRAGHDLEALGVSVLCVGGKPNLDRPFIIFSRLGIPSYMVFDGDQVKGETGALNESLLRIAGETPVLFPDTSVRAQVACAHNKLQDVVQSEIGDAFANTLAEVATELGYSQSTQASKNPVVLAEVLKRCHVHGHSSATLGAIVGASLRLLPGTLQRMDTAQRNAGQPPQGELFSPDPASGLART